MAHCRSSTPVQGKKQIANGHSCLEIEAGDRRPVSRACPLSIGSAGKIALSCLSPLGMSCQAGAEKSLYLPIQATPVSLKAEADFEHGETASLAK